MQQEQPAIESVVAVLPTEIKETETLQEQNMKSSVSAVELKAKSVVVKSQDDYEKAAEFVKEIKRVSASVTEFFAPIKTAANQAHKAVCNREKEMLTPLVNAEKEIKKTMGDYILEQERLKRAEEERLRKLAQEEANRKLQEAMTLEEKGDKQAAEESLAEADFMENAANNVVVTAPKTSAEGVSYTSSWEVEAIDNSKVPVYHNGVCLRPVDEKAVLSAIKAAKGQIEIPGVKFKEVKVLTIRK